MPGGETSAVGRELPVPVHEEHEPPVPVGRHLDLVDAAAEAPEVGAGAGQRLERRVAQRHALGLRAHLDRGREGVRRLDAGAPWPSAGARGDHDEQRDQRPIAAQRSPRPRDEPAGTPA